MRFNMYNNEFAKTIPKFDEFKEILYRDFDVKGITEEEERLYYLMFKAGFEEAWIRKPTRAPFRWKDHVDEAKRLRTACEKGNTLAEAEELLSDVRDFLDALLR